MYALLRRAVRTGMNSQRRLSAKKSKRKLARTKSLGNLASLSSNRHVVPRVHVERAPAVPNGRRVRGIESGCAHPLVREYEAIVTNWSRFEGMPMQMLLLVRHFPSTSSNLNQSDYSVLQFLPIQIILLQNLRSSMPPSGQPGSVSGQEPEVVYVTFSKVNGSMGLSIVAAKVCLVFFFRPLKALFCVLLNCLSGFF